MSDGITAAYRHCKELTNKDFEDAKHEVELKNYREAKFKRLYIATNKLVNRIGADGEITAHADEVHNVINTLSDIDTGIFDVDFVFSNHALNTNSRFTLKEDNMSKEKDLCRAVAMTQDIPVLLKRAIEDYKEKNNMSEDLLDLLWEAEYFLSEISNLISSEQNLLNELYALSKKEILDIGYND